MSVCKHPKLQSTARRDYCPDCQYEYYYGDAHAQGEAQLSKLINPGRDGNQVSSPSRYSWEAGYDDRYDQSQDDGWRDDDYDRY